jgi:hypothetical protein
MYLEGSLLGSGDWVSFQLVGAGSTQLADAAGFLHS